MDVPLSELESAALQVIPHGLIILDIRARVRMINRRAEKLLGIQSDEVMGSDFKNIPSGTDLTRFPRNIDGKNNWTIAVGDRVLDITAIDLRHSSHGEIGTLILYRDITNPQIQSEIFTLFQVDLMAPLPVILGYCDLLLQEREDFTGTLTETQRNFISIINSKTKEILDMRQRYVEEYKRRHLDAIDE